MKKFKFSLETVLSYKQQVLDSKQNEHAVLLKELYDQEQLVAECWEQYRAYNEEYRRRSDEGMPITEALLYQSGLRALELEIQKQTRKLKDAQEREDKKRSEVVEAKQETSSIETLKDKKFTAYRKEAGKQEEQQIEEFVSSTRAMRELAV